MNAPLISVIIPIYNVEPYLHRCVDSVLAQTYRNIEIILVDDGSPDNCPAICDEYAEKDSRVKVIHKENGGVSSARNAGLDIAKGDYIGFVDSDDWIEPDMYEVLYSAIQNTGADIASIVVNTGDTQPIKKGNVKLFTSSEALKEVCKPQIGLPVSVWSKLSKAELFENIRFSNEITIGEDKLINGKLYLKSCSIAYQPYACYHYFYREGSAMSGYRESDWTIQKAAETLYEIVCPKVAKKYADYMWADQDIQLALKFAWNNVLSLEKYKKIRQHMMLHFSMDLICVSDWKHKCLFLSFCAGRIPFIVASKGITTYKRIVQSKPEGNDVIK